MNFSQTPLTQNTNTEPRSFASFFGKRFRGNAEKRTDEPLEDTQEAEDRVWGNRTGSAVLGSWW